MGWCMENCKCHSYLHHHRWTSEIKKNRQEKALLVHFANSVAKDDEIVEGKYLSAMFVLFFVLNLCCPPPPNILLLFNSQRTAPFCHSVPGKKLMEIFL